MVASRALLSTLLIAFALPLHAEPPRNLVRNPGFEVGEGLPLEWDVHEDVEENSPGWVKRDTQVFHGGAASLHLHLPNGEPDVQAVVQAWDVNGPLAALRGTSLFFSAWVKAENVAVCQVWIEFLDAKGWQISIHNLSPTQPVWGTADWSEFGRALTVPEETARMGIGISLYHAGDVWVDDVALMSGMPEADVAAAIARTTPTAPTATLALLTEVQGSCWATASQDTADGGATLRVSVPFPFEGQAPLALRVGTIPDGRVHALRIARAAHEDTLEADLKALRAGETVRLFWQAVVLTTDRLLDPRALVAARISAPESVPEDVRPWLGPEPGIELDAPIVQGMAERLKSYQGFFLDFLQGMNAAVQDRLIYREGGVQSADLCLSKKRAGAVGYANSVAAVARAGNVPARLLACVPWEYESGEQFLVEMYGGPGTGWVRCDPLAGAVPWGDARQVVLRVVLPGDARWPDHTPVAVRGRGPVRVGLIQGALKQAAALRSDPLVREALPFPTAGALLQKARSAWEAAAARPLGAESRFLIAADLPLDFAGSGPPLAQADAIVQAAWKRHANLLDSLQMGWGQSLVRNPGFEEENRGRPSGWHLPPGRRTESEIAVAGGAALRGERALHATLKENRNRYEVVSQRVSRFPVGLPLVLSVYVRGNCPGGVVLRTTYQDEGRNPLGKPIEARAKPEGGDTWHRLSLDLEAPRAAATIQLDLDTEGPGELWVDEFDLRAGGGFPAWPGEELLANPGFEESGDEGMPAAWRGERPPRSGEEIDLAQEVSGREDKWAGYLSSTREDAVLGLSQLVRHVPASGRVRLRGWVRTDRLNGTASLQMVFRMTPFEEGADSPDRVSTESSQPVGSTTKWTELTLEADVPPGTLSILVRAAANGSGRVWFDDLSLQAVAK